MSFFEALFMDEVWDIFVKKVDFLSWKQFDARNSENREETFYKATAKKRPGINSHEPKLPQFSPRDYRVLLITILQ